MKIEIKNGCYTGAMGRESAYDLIIPQDWNGKLVLFVHGYMGFKDWGCWDLVGQFFVDNSYGFVKYNVSHNGGTLDQPIDFPDTAAFAQNTYSKELTDFSAVIDTVTDILQKNLDTTPSGIHAIGHSRGGGITALQSGHPQVLKWSSWAGISSIEKRFPKGEALETWRTDTYRYVKNGRTLQELPHHFDQFLDFEMHRNRLDIETHCRNNEKPCLIIHGDNDTSVLLEEGEALAKWTQTTLVVIQNTQHTFDGSHPWTNTEMPSALKEACQQTLLFFES